MSVEAYIATVQRMIQWAIRDINNLVARVDMSDPDAARDALQAEMPTLIAVWGEIAATQAAEYFEELIGEPAVMAEPVEPAAVESMVGWAVGPLYGVKNDDGTVTPPDPAKARRNLEGGAQRHVLNTGRNTIRYSAESRPGVGWARVLQGEQDCAFCVVLASRGAVYESEETAGGQTESGNDPRRKLGDRYHDHCDCLVLPVRDESDYPEGYDVDGLYDMYLAARKRAGSKTLDEGKRVPGKKLSEIPDSDKDILQLMREMYGMH